MKAKKNESPRLGRLKLAAAGLVRDVKVGRERLWEFEPTQLDEARRSLELIAQQWDHALAKLKRAVESR